MSWLRVMLRELISRPTGREMGVVRAQKSMPSFVLSDLMAHSTGTSACSRVRTRPGIRKPGFVWFCGSLTSDKSRALLMATAVQLSNCVRRHTCGRTIGPQVEEAHLQEVVHGNDQGALGSGGSRPSQIENEGSNNVEAGYLGDVEALLGRVGKFREPASRFGVGRRRLDQQNEGQEPQEQSGAHRAHQGRLSLEVLCG